jgi:4-amino-4-deoxy-L-arabinose transferase-like glycosyltransferase
MTITPKSLGSYAPFDRGENSLLVLCILIIAIRFLFVPVMGIVPQDAYYDFYAQHLALSYYDHPPLIAYILRISTTLFGKKVFALKLADTIVTIFFLIAFYKLAGKFLSKNKTRLATALAISTVMISILSLISTPDVPLMLCWTLTVNCLHEAIWKKKNIYWIWAGISTGLSFDSKYTAVFLIAGLIGFLLLVKQYRKLLFSPWFLFYILCFIITILPVIVWNSQNQFASFKFQSEGRLNEGLHIDVSGFAGVIGHQAGILLPILFFSLIYFIVRIGKKYGFAINHIPADQLFLLSFFIPLFLGFFTVSFFYWVKLNWMMPSYITGIVWVARFWKKKWLKYQLVFSLVVHVLLGIEIIFYIIPIRSDDTWFGWPELAARVEKLHQQYPETFIFSTVDYKTAAVLNFFLNDDVYAKNIVGERALQFDYVGTDLQKLKGKDAIFINSNPRFDNLKNEITLPFSYYSYFDSIVPIQPILIERNNQVVRKFSVFICKGYHFPK